MPISPHDCDDCVTRFIRSERDCKKGRIKLSVFIPRNDDTEISVFVISCLPESKIWRLGCKKLKRPIPARADLTVSSICEKGFGIVTSNPPSKHAGIVPVPKLPIPNNRNDHRNESAIKTRREIAAKLVTISKLKKKP